MRVRVRTGECADEWKRMEQYEEQHHQIYRFHSSQVIPDASSFLKHIFFTGFWSN